MTRREHPRDAIVDLVSGRLDDAVRSEVEAHLETCAACRDADTSERVRTTNRCVSTPVSISASFAWDPPWCCCSNCATAKRCNGTPTLASVCGSVSVSPA